MLSSPVGFSCVPSAARVRPLNQFAVYVSAVEGSRLMFRDGTGCDLAIDRSRIGTSGACRIDAERWTIGAVSGDRREGMMTAETWMMIANLLQGWGVPMLSLVAYLPQWRKLIRTRSSEDISLGAWLLWSVSTLFAVFYAVVQFVLHGHGLALIISSVTGLLFILVTIFLVLRYRLHSSVPAEE
jgi:uncharacterized protein with PQ loop repeat